MAEKRKLIFLMNRWMSTAGGIQSFNRHLAMAIGSTVQNVSCYCLATVASPEERAHASQHGVTLIAGENESEWSSMLLSDDFNRHKPSDAFAVIGHSYFSGEAARDLRKRLYPSAIHAHFVHMNPLDTESLKEYRTTEFVQEREKKLAQERQLASDADIVFCVGPRLTRYMRDLLQVPGRNSRVVQVDCGLQQSNDKTYIPEQPTLLCSGRTDSIRVKGLDIFALAGGHLLKLWRESSSIVAGRPEPRLVVRGAKADAEKLEQKLRAISQRIAPSVNIIVQPYTSNSDELISDFLKSSIFMMPSRAEGYGLVAAEAMSFGVPVVMSAASGFGELVFQAAKESNFSPEPFVVQMHGTDEEVSLRFAEAAFTILVNEESARTNLHHVRRIIYPRCSWESAGRALVAELERNFDSKVAVREIPSPLYAHSPPARLNTANQNERPSQTEFPAVSLEGMLTSYRQVILTKWSSRWCELCDDNRKLEFIDSQKMLLLSEEKSPLRFLHAQFLRSGLSVENAPTAPDESVAWMSVDRVTVADEISLNSVGGAYGNRVVIVADAGLGKTTTLAWLCQRINRESSGNVAFFLDIGSLSSDDDPIFEAILEQLKKAVEGDLGQWSDSSGRAFLDQLLANGRVVILLDSLDQASSASSVVGTLSRLFGSPRWQNCGVVLSSRLQALQRHWSAMFDGGGWRFITLAIFTEEQRRTFLGLDQNGRTRYDNVPKNARHILGNPRVLTYLHSLPASKFDAIGNAADVYWYATNHLLMQAMRGSERARSIGLIMGESPTIAVSQRSLRQATRLLSAIAFEMTSMLVASPSETHDAKHIPNFDRVSASQMDAFIDSTCHRMNTRDRRTVPRDLERDLDGLAALNIVGNEMFEPDVEGLKQIIWSNRSLQEFFTAIWITQFDDGRAVATLRKWLYLPHDSATEEYYWVWRFVCEMPSDGRNPNVWVSSLEPLFRPGDGTTSGTMRSCEMIFRAWPSVQKEAAAGHTGAKQLLDSFLGEFENEILSGKRKRESQVAAEFCQRFVNVPAGRCQLGAPMQKQGMPEDSRREWIHKMETMSTSELVTDYLSNWYFPPGPQGQKQREIEKEWWSARIENRDLTAISKRQFPINETPAEAIVEVLPFALHESPIVNKVFRLFDPGHGIDHSSPDNEYANRSPFPESPAIFVSWYDAWVFCKWACWNGESCRLPYEDEWEHAAKAGTSWDLNYWWGDEFDAKFCHAGIHKRTATPAKSRENPWRLQDILGNVWEWCQDEWRIQYNREISADGQSRALRGGSWRYAEYYSRTAKRHDRSPNRRTNDVGFRPARSISTS